MTLRAAIGLLLHPRPPKSFLPKSAHWVLLLAGLEGATLGLGLDLGLYTGLEAGLGAG